MGRIDARIQHRHHARQRACGNGGIPANLAVAPQLIDAGIVRKVGARRALPAARCAGVRAQQFDRGGEEVRPVAVGFGVFDLWVRQRISQPQRRCPPGKGNHQEPARGLDAVNVLTAAELPRELFQANAAGGKNDESGRQRLDRASPAGCARARRVGPRPTGTGVPLVVHTGSGAEEIVGDGGRLSPAIRTRRTFTFAYLRLVRLHGGSPRGDCCCKCQQRRGEASRCTSRYHEVP